jgi:hypothetical protein
MRPRSIVILLFAGVGAISPFVACNGSTTATAPLADARAAIDAPVTNALPAGDAMAAPCGYYIGMGEGVDAAGCSSLEVLYDAGPLCSVPCGSIAVEGTGSCTVPCGATVCCGGDYAIPVYLQSGQTICARWGLPIDAGCGTYCSECGGYTCPGNDLCSADCFCNVNDGIIGIAGQLPPDPWCVEGYVDAGNESANDDAGCSGSKSGVGGAGGCARCRQ